MTVRIMRVAVLVACTVAGGVVWHAITGFVVMGVIYGLFAGGGALILLDRALERDRRSRALCRPLPDPVHRWVIADARRSIRELGWSPMAPHGRTDNPHVGLCAKAALQRSSARAITLGVTRDPRIAGAVLEAFGQWLEDHGMAPAGWAAGRTGAGALPPFWNDSQMSEDWVLAVFALAAGETLTAQEAASAPLQTRIVRATPAGGLPDPARDPHPPAARLVADVLEGEVV